MSAATTFEAEVPWVPDHRTLLWILRRENRASSEDPPIDLPARAWKDFPAMAAGHGVAPLLHRAVQSGAMRERIPPETFAELAEERRFTALDNLRRFGAFRRIARALQTAGIPLIALKGMHLAELVYRDLSLRPMSDIDILVRHSQVDAAVAVLASLGYRPVAKRPSGYDITLNDPQQGILLELHWGLAAPSEPSSPSVEEAWRTAVPATLADTDVLVMAPECLLLHMCTHLAYHHLFATNFRALCDIDEIARTAPQMDWESLVDQTKRSGTSRGVAAVLRMAREHLGTAVPESVHAGLGGNALEQRLLEDALEQMRVRPDLPRALLFAPNLLRITSAVGSLASISLLWNRIFVPRAEIAALYGVSDHPARVLPYYAVRLWGLLKTYTGSIRTLATGRTDIAAGSARSDRLAHWLDASRADAESNRGGEGGIRTHVTLP